MPAATCQDHFSSIEHVAQICSLQNWRDVPMVMLSAGFDVSYDQPLKRYLIMAGFVSSAERWKDFDLKWRARLADDGLPYFQMRAFAQSDKPFNKGWRDNEPRRKSLLGDLLDILSSHAFHKFSCVIQSDAFEKLGEEDRKTAGENALALAGTLTHGDVEHWRIGRDWKQPPEFVFEDGDKGRGALRESFKSLTGKEPLFRPKKDNPEKGVLAFTPLQAADIFAYEVKKITDEIGKLLPADFRWRFPFGQLNKMPGDPKIFDVEGAEQMKIMLRVKRHFDANPLPTP